MDSNSYPDLSAYPSPLIVPPLDQHKQTFIILHGRGSNATKFSSSLLQTPIPDFKNLAEAFPDTKFIFPTASKRRAASLNRSLVNQWFDIWTLKKIGEREEVQIEGLRETSAYIHGLLRDEIELVGKKNVMLWGLSQGWAASLVAVLTWAGPPFAAAVGMCGWMPLRRQIEEIARNNEQAIFEDLGAEDQDDPFEREVDEVADLRLDTPTKAISYLRDELDMEILNSSMSFQQIPIFLGHGDRDEKVPIELGREAASCLAALGVDVRLKEYEEIGHWYSEQMLQDIVRFLRERFNAQDAVQS